MTNLEWKVEGSFGKNGKIKWKNGKASEVKMRTILSF